jgi:hypothetical protein
LYQRLQEHLRNIKQGVQHRVNPNPNKTWKLQAVGLHFAAADHIGTRDLKIQVLDFINLHPESPRAEKIRLRVEKKWIHLLRCPAPNGMNIFD